MESNAHQISLTSQISHELRIPLTGIMGVAHLLEATPLNFEQKEYLKVIITSAKRLLSLEDKLHALVLAPMGKDSSK